MNARESPNFAASAVREFESTAVIMPRNPAKVELKAPIKKPIAVGQPRYLVKPIIRKRITATKRIV